MVRTLGRRKAMTRSILIALVLMMALGTLAFAQGKRYSSQSAWSFGVMGDTQWTVANDPEGVNPEYVSAAVARAIENRFIDNGVKFVIQVGDLTDRSGDAGLAARAAAAQPLFDAGIGFFPIRGNHEGYGYLYGLDPEWNVNVPGYKASFPQTQGLANTFGATNFSSPGIDILKGLSYSFDYGSSGNNARFVFVDVEPTSYTKSVAPVDPVYGQGYFYLGWVVFKATATVPGGSISEGTWFRISSAGKPSTNFYGYEKTWPIETYITNEKYDSAGTEFWPGTQQSWISAQLDKSTRGTEHAFVMSHRPMMGANHVDGLFGSNPGSKASTQNPFYASLMNNGVRYMISAHDHIHNRARVASPDGLSSVEQLISIGASTKFYTPASLDSFAGSYGDVKQRETEISQETRNIGYYVYTVDGPRVTVDYYSDAVGGFQDMEDYPYGDASVPARLYMPQFNFVKKETWGYSTNGKQFAVAQGGSYTPVQDSFGGSSAQILAGTNNSTAKDQTPVVIDDKDTEDTADDVTLSAPRAFTKFVNTGWASKPANPAMKSDILSLWGMADFGTEQTDTYVLSMSFDMSRDLYLRGGGIGIAALDANNNWVNAVDLNFGGTKGFVLGPYQAGYPLGSYGIDYTTRTAWAVLNYNADFVVFNGIEDVVQRYWRIR